MADRQLETVRQEGLKHAMLQSLPLIRSELLEFRIHGIISLRLNVIMLGVHPARTPRDLGILNIKRDSQQHPERGTGSVESSVVGWIHDPEHHSAARFGLVRFDR